MGFFSKVRNAFIEANEEAHGARLLSDTQSFFPSFIGLENHLQFAIMVGYLEIRGRLMQEMRNWSKEGRIKIGRTMQSQAREKHDLDVAGSYAKWLAGCWIESKERNSLKAQQAFGLLEGFANHLITETAKPNIEHKENSTGFGYANYDQWFLEFKKSAGRTNPKLALDGNNQSLVDFMDQEPLKISFRDCVDPISLGQYFAQQYDFSTFGR